MRVRGSSCTKCQHFALFDRETACPGFDSMIHSNMHHTAVHAALCMQRGRLTMSTSQPAHFGRSLLVLLPSQFYFGQAACTATPCGNRDAIPCTGGVGLACTPCCKSVLAYGLQLDAICTSTKTCSI